MKRRTFLYAALTLLLSPKHLIAKRTTRMLKGFHLAPTFTAAVVNQMGCDVWVGTDGILQTIWDASPNTDLASISGEYWHRAPGVHGADAIEYVRSVPTFTNRWILTNEYDLHYSVPESVAIIESLVTTIQAGYTNPAIPQLYLNMGSDVANLTHHTAVWDALSPVVRNRIDGFTFHRYRQDLSAANFKTDARKASNWMKARGLGNLKLYCGEFGLDAEIYSQDEAAQFAADVWNTMKDVSWCDGLFWYFANAGELNYVKLLNDAQTKLTKTGRAWRDAV